MFEIKNTSNTPELISARTLILTIGILGFIFPILLIIIAVLLQDCEFVQNSISAYYHTISRNVFVGTLCAIALCLYAYKGYSKVDDLAGNIAAFLALGVAFFPTSVGEPFTKCLPHEINTGLEGKIHFISAALLFLTLAFFSLFLFTKSKGKKKSTNKIIRNRIYKICGYLILLCILLIACYFFFFSKKFPALAGYRPVFWLETFALWAFSISWATKSKLFLK